MLRIKAARYFSLTLRFCVFGLYLAPVLGQSASGPPSPSPGEIPESAPAPLLAKIHLRGLKYTKPQVVFRELETREGAPFDSALLASDLRSLEKLDIFASITPHLKKVEQGLDLTLEFVEIPRVILHPTGEYTEENGISVGAGALSTNLWGLNHYFEASFKTGFQPEGVRRISFEYMLPRVGNARSTPQIWVADEQRDNKIIAAQPVRENYQTARLRVRQIHRQRRKFRLGTEWEAGLEKYAFPHDSLLVSSGYDGLATAGLTFFYDGRNAQGNPNQGYYGEAGLYHTGGFLGGDVNYLSVFLDQRTYFPVSERQHFLASGLLTLQKKTGPGGVPLYKNFWIGGANSIRGYEVGHQRGVQQLIFTLEYRYLLLPPTVIPLFLFDWKVDIGLQPFLGVDYGTTWNDKLGEQEFLFGQAAGLQILIPYKQMVRFELGVSGLTGSSEVQFQFHLATEAKPVVQRYRRR